MSLCSLLILGCVPGGDAPPAAEPPSVGVIAVTEERVNPYFEFVGKTRAADTVALRARVTGFLLERAFQEGGQVEAGDLLFRIEPEQYQASLAQAEAQLSAAEASLNRAQVDLARYQELAKAKNVSQQKVDEAQAEVLVQEAAVETAQADIQKAQLNVDYTEIRAPIAGRIDLAAFDVGNLVEPASGVLATINRMDPIKVAFSIAETWYLELAQAGARARHGQDPGQAPDEPAAPGKQRFVPQIRLPDGSLYAHDGWFDFFDNKVDETTGTVLIRAQFPNPDQLLLPGQFVTVVIERREAVSAVVVPQAALLTDQGGSYVLVVGDDDKVESRRVKTGQRFGTRQVIEEGLEAGERIVLYGIQKVRPGIQVRPEVTTPPGDPLAATGPASSGDTDTTAGD
ncbi:efflux RND transporter periplasmic adaptor subunit [Marichromatium gracile]|uniref:efflux RND transporter periplasmic adaptor subunit n=1 Tax=Marichromatium gracile TaxID=1048 RepID=UPI0013660BF1|nr:efflux RND transporter periplasmic adaptor subunit [Marichromatium gracile]